MDNAKSYHNRLDALKGNWIKWKKLNFLINSYEDLAEAQRIVLLDDDEKELEIPYSKLPEFMEQNEDILLAGNTSKARGDTSNKLTRSTAIRSIKQSDAEEQDDQEDVKSKGVTLSRVVVRNPGSGNAGLAAYMENVGSMNAEMIKKINKAVDAVQSGEENAIQKAQAVFAGARTMNEIRMQERELIILAKEVSDEYRPLPGKINKGGD